MSRTPQKRATETRGEREPRSGAESSRKVLKILTSFEPESPIATVDELARRVGIPMSSAYRYVALLREVGLLTEDGQGAYHLSPRVVRMAQAARAAYGFLDLAQPVMERLRDETAETVLLVRRVGDHAICLDRAESDQPIRLSFQIGYPQPLHKGAAAKVLLAWLPETEQRRYLERLSATEANFDNAGLSRELTEIRDCGWSSGDVQAIPDIWAAAAPIFEGNDVAAALAIAGPCFRIDEPKRAAILASTRGAAAQITAALSQVSR